MSGGEYKSILGTNIIIQTGNIILFERRRRREPNLTIYELRKNIEELETELENQQQENERIKRSLSSQIRTPLNGALNYLELAREESPNNSTLTAVQKELNSLIDFVNTLSRQTKTPIAVEEIQLQEVMQQVKQRIPQKNIIILNPNKQLSLRTSNNRLNLVLKTLLKGIPSKNIIVRVQESPQQIFLKIETETIEVKQLEQIREMLIQIEGTISISSEAIEISLPKELRTNEKSGNRVIIIDDDRNTTEILKKILSRNGFTVYTANSGREGIQIIESIDADIILLDIIMPNLDGWEVMEWIRERNIKTPVMIMTFLDVEEIKGKVEEDNIIHKPITEEKIIKAIEKKLSSKQEEILIIDDDPLVQRVIKEILEKKGYRTKTARNGAEGLEQINQQTKLILLDLTMPVMNGFEFLEKLYRYYKQPPKIIVISSENLSEEKIKELEQKTKFRLPKHKLNQERLIQLIREVCQDSSSSSSSS